MYLPWDEYFILNCQLVAMRSKDPNTKVGACIVNDHKRIIAVGYNGMPAGDDESFPWEREGDPLETKYRYVVHAELNALLNRTMNVDDCVLYTSLFPCSDCAKAIVQARVKEVVYLSDKYEGTEDNVASKRILKATGVKTRQVIIKEPVVLSAVEQ